MSTNKQTNIGAEKKHRPSVSWINSHRRATGASQEKRKYPRVDCDCPAIVEGYSGVCRVTDFSFGGCFVECQSNFSSKLETGKLINLAVKFPTENEMLDFKIKVIRAGNRGIACKFEKLNQPKIDALKRFFSFSKETQPIF